MDNLGMRVTLTLGLLALAMAPAQAERYIVEPIADTVPGNMAEEQGLSQAELDQVLAPIALYPDALLSQVLIAATYPLEIVEAARWSRQNPHLEGDAAVEAVADRDWDPSVKALVAFPDLLAQMDEDLDWTRKLGDAMLFQEEQVMDSIQFLRARADAAGHLETNEYARVIRQEETIIIEPAQTRVVYVPYYDPRVVYGTWWRPAYPPVYWVPPPYYSYGYPGFYWGSGIHLHSGFFFSNFYWPHRSVVIVHTPRYHYSPRYRHHFAPGQRWKHNPRHRRGVDYRHRDVRQRYDQPRLRAGPVTRWPLESGAARTERGSRDGSRDGSHHTGSGQHWRDRSTATTSSGRSARPSPPATGDTTLRAGPRTVRPSLSGTEERLRDTRRGTDANSRPQQREAAAHTQRFTAPSQRATAPSQRSTAPTYRATAPAPRSGAPTYRATAPTQRSAVPTQRATGPSQRAATPRAGGRGAETRAAPNVQRESRGSSRGGGEPSRDRRRVD
jgi:hypothetical protein